MRVNVSVTGGCNAACQVTSVTNVSPSTWSCGAGINSTANINIGSSANLSITCDDNAGYTSCASAGSPSGITNVGCTCR